MSEFSSQETPDHGQDHEALAMREHLEGMGVVKELDIGVLQVTTRAGRRLKWLRLFGSKAYRLVEQVEP